MNLSLILQTISVSEDNNIAKVAEKQIVLVYEAGPPKRLQTVVICKRKDQLLFFLIGHNSIYLEHVDARLEHDHKH